MTRTLERKLQKLMQKVAQEKLRNELRVQESIGIPVYYGAEVQILHHDSRDFVCGSTECSQNIKVGYKCFLSKWYSKRMVFRVKAQLKSRNEGESIQYRDLLVLENIESQSYLSFCYSQMVGMFEFDPDIPVTNPFRPKLSMGNPYTETYECFLSLIATTAFSCIFHSSSRRDPRLLRGQIMFRIIHCETEGRLGVDVPHVEAQNEIFIRKNKTPNHLEDDPGSTIWEAEHPLVLDSGRPFRLNRFNEVEESKHSSPIILKHVASELRMELASRSRDTNSYLEIDRDVPVLEKLKNQARSENNFWQGQQVFLYPLVKSQDQVQFDQSYFLANSNQRFLKLEGATRVYSRDPKIRAFMSSKKSEIERNHFSPLAESVLGFTKHVCSFSTGVSTRDTFLLKAVPEEECRFALFLKSAVPLLSLVSDNFREGASKTDNAKSARKAILDSLYFRVVHLLRKLTTFLVDREALSEEELESVEIEPNPKKQQLLRDFGLIDLLMEIIYFPLKNEFYSLPELRLSCPFTPVIRNCYVLLRKGIEEFRSNELYASQWLKVIIDHSIMTGQDNNIQADRAMRELIDNNRTILESITEDTIKMYIFILKRNPMQDDKYIVILRALCICDGSPVVHNQKMLTDLLLRNPDTRKALLVPLRSFEDGPIEVYIPDEDLWEDLEVFVKSASRQRFYSYILSMTNLLSDVCFERNYAGIEALQAHYPITTCLAILTRELLPNDIRQAFGRLMTHLWINVSPYYKIVLPNPIKTYEGLSDNISFTHYYGKRIIYDKVKAYIPKYILSFAAKPVRSFLHEIPLLNCMLEITL